MTGYIALTLEEKHSYARLLELERIGFISKQGQEELAELRKANPQEDEFTFWWKYYVLSPRVTGFDKEYYENVDFSIKKVFRHG